LNKIYNKTSYCQANNLDLSPESDAGRGPVDFKISQGFNDKIKKVFDYKNKHETIDNKLPNIIVIDATEKNQLVRLEKYNKAG